MLFLNRALFLSETMNQALAKKDLDLAATQKAAEEKTAFADQKLASVGKLVEENAKLKTALDEANKEATYLKKDKVTLNKQLESMSRRRNGLEAYIKALAKKLFLMLEGTFLYPTDSLFASHHELVDSLTP